MASFNFSVEDGVATLLLSNPPQNRLGGATSEGFRAGIEKVETDPTIRALVIRAEGDNFSYGGDISSWLEVDPAAIGASIGDGLKRLRDFEELRVPVVSAVQGICLGGAFEIVLRTDIIVAAEEKPKDEIKRYGVVNPGAVKGNATEVKGVVEKPATGTEPSNLCVIGRYILQPEIFAILDKQERGAGNEIQLTDAMAQMIGKTPFHAVKTDCARYDCGDKVGFLHANIAVGLSRADIAPALRAILKDIAP